MLRICLSIGFFLLVAESLTAQTGPLSKLAPVDSPAASRPLNTDSLRKPWNLCLGSVLLPVKLRPGNGKEKYFEFSTDILLAAAISACYQSPNKHCRLHLLGSSGLSLVQIDSLNSGGKQPQPLHQTAFTGSAGMLFQQDEWQLGLFCGMDFLAGKNSRIWLYQGDTWLSLGFGFLWNTKKPPH